MIAPATILAIASPPGRSLRGIIRISGAAAFDLLGPHVQFTTGGMRRGELTFDQGDSFSILVLASRGPHSYTGEDSIELQMPGNPALLERVIDALIASGGGRGIDVRRAEPGEFTARAFLNGRIDLTQAEGVAATIAAQSDAELGAARLLTLGRLSAFAHDAADRLAAALALVEAGIDFTDQDDVVAITPADLHARLSDLRTRMDSQLRHAVGIEQLRAIPWVAIIGRPNAGKSTLFNALLGHERAVVSPVAGTTRDVLAEPLTVETSHGRAEVMLVDLAGLDDVDDSSMNALMQAAAHAALDRAELKLRCVAIDEECADPQSDEIVVRTKCDLNRSTPARGEARTGIRISALTGENLDALRTAISERLSNRAVSLAADALALQPRHEAALRSALANIDGALGLIAAQHESRALQHPELIASSMRMALDDLAALAGDMTPDDILGRIFASFCIGK